MLALANAANTAVAPSTPQRLSAFSRTALGAAHRLATFHAPDAHTKELPRCHRTALNTAAWHAGQRGRVTRDAKQPMPRTSPLACARAAPPGPFPAGARACGKWIPFDVWVRLAHAISGPAEQQAFGRVCAVAAAALAVARAPAQAAVRAGFHLCTFALPDTVVDKVLMVHVVPPRGTGLVLFVDESDVGNGVELAWLKRGRLCRVALGLETVPASAVSNIRFAPDGRSVALLITLAHESLVAPDGDPLRRLRGWGALRTDRGRLFDIEYDPCEDCTVQIVDLEEDDMGYPADLVVHTFSHVFVPEYGFDMVWRSSELERSGNQELAFVAMLHSDAGAATYLVRWKTFRNPNASNFIFMACIDGASAELLRDKKVAMVSHPSTVCTSRIEIANDAKHIFFDTVSKFGILRFDQVNDSRAARVTRADLPNNPVTQFWRLSRRPSCTAVAAEGWGHVEDQRRDRDCSMDSRLHSFIGTEDVVSNILSDTVRISRMSPDGSLLCSIVNARPVAFNEGFGDMPTKHVEMRSSLTGRLIYRRVVARRPDPEVRVGSIRLRLEKSGDIAQHTMGFSDDSSMLFVWDTQHTNIHCICIQRLPIVLDTATGSLIQDFCELSSKLRYESVQMSPDGRTIYGTRMQNDTIRMDAIDVLSGTVLKTVTLTEPVHPPNQFSAHSIYLLPNRRLHTVSRGNVDVLWDTTRGSLGCGWRSIPHQDASEQS